MLTPESYSVFEGDDRVDKMTKRIFALSMLENLYKFKGFYIVHTDLYDPELDLDGYIKNLYNILGKYVIYINETLTIDEFIDFKKSTLLKITRINKDDSTKSKSKSNTQRIKSSVGLNSKRFYSTSLPQKLIVNSTYNNIVFVDNQSILLLSSLLNVDLPNVKYAEQVKFVINDLKNGGLDKSDSLKYRKPFF